MEPTNRTARLAGAVYLSLILFAPFALMYVPNALIVRGNAAATMANIRAHETMFRLGMAAELWGDVIFIVLTVILYRLFNHVDRMQAVLMTIFGILSVPIHFAAVASDIVAVIAAKTPAYLTAVFSAAQIDALAMLFLTLHGRTFVVLEVFWGIWLLPFGILVYKSRFIPRIFGVLLIINGIAYVAQSLTGLVLPDAAALVERLALPAQFGEIWITLWLLIKGANVEQSVASLRAQTVTA